MSGFREFQVRALGAERFAHLFGMTDTELREHRAMREVVRAKPGAPCRVSLQDAEVSEEVLLVQYTHQPADSPFHASHAVYVRPGAEEARPEVGEVPELLRLRTLSVRGFDDAGMMTAAEVTPGRELEECLQRVFDADTVRYVHVHFAGPGCYAARVERV